MTNYNPHLCAQTIQKKITTPAKVAVILGSGLGGFATQLQATKTMSYAEIPGFPTSNIAGHHGKIIAGTLQETPIICFQGRVHRYQGTDSHIIVKNMIRALKLMGIEHLILTNAAGSLEPDMPPGSIMLISDHINMQLENPLLGDNDDDFGPRFPPIDAAYDAKSRQRLKQIAAEHNIPLPEGTYLSVMGPSYETKAEIAAFKVLGANAVGMSTVPEVIVANHCNLRLSALSIITNFATGLATEQHDHQAVVHTAEQAATDLSVLLTQFISTL
jgi:purine-nucleoside phosphorylase